MFCPNCSKPTEAQPTMRLQMFACLSCGCSWVMRLMQAVGPLKKPEVQWESSVVPDHLERLQQ